jgi:hypothetical protein
MFIHFTRREKFTQGYIDFINDNFNICEHYFILIGGEIQSHHNIKLTSNIKIIDSKILLLKNSITIFLKLKNANKIFIHGFSQPVIYVFFLIFPWLLNKCFWVIWGADLYYFTKKKNRFKDKFFEYVRKIILKKIKFIISPFSGDIENAKNWYSPLSKGFVCNIYPRAVSFIEFKNNKDIYKNIIIGNSGSVENNHLEAFELLKKYKDESIKIYVPLSYGDKNYIEKIKSIGYKIFGDKFMPLEKFMPLDEYIKFIQKIDVAIYPNFRQQGTGNMIIMLGSGKKVFIKNTITPWQHFNNLGFYIYDLDKTNITPLSMSQVEHNIKIAKEYYSEKNSVIQWNYIFHYDMDKNSQC